MHINLKPEFQFQVSASEMNCILRSLSKANNPEATQLANKIIERRKSLIEEWKEKIEESDKSKLKG